MTRTDLIIIGSGPGGYRAAEYAAKNGLQVVVAEKLHAGGTCLNCGCIPTKTFCHDAELIDELKDAEGLGLEGVSYRFNFAKAMERKQAVVATLRAGVETLMALPGITFVRGEAKLTGTAVPAEGGGTLHTVEIGGAPYAARNVIIATGSSPKMPPVKGIGSPAVLDSTGLLDIDRVPARLCIVGAGVIGMEFAGIFSSFGSEVTVVEFLKECLPPVDSDIAKRMRKSMERKGVKFFFQSAVKEIDGGTVIFDRKGKEERVEADCILIATGRQPNTGGIGLEAAGVAFDRKGIRVDDHMQTSVPGIYAIGDVNGRLMLAHAATAQGFRAVNHILGRADGIRLDVIPSAVFTNPEVGSVGLTEDQCKEGGIAHTVRKAYYRSNGKALAMNATDGMLKLLAGDDGRIIGCHLYGAHAADIAQEAAALMSLGATVAQLGEIVHTHPTLGELLQDAAL